METSTRLMACIAAALWLHGAVAATAPPAGAKPGDDALSCTQIHDQGMAEVQRDQQERTQRADVMRAQQNLTMGLGTASVLSGAAAGTAHAAQRAAETSADQSVAMLTAPPKVNVRLERLKQLSAHKHCADSTSADNSRAVPVDAMTCEQIATELSHHAQQLQPAVQALAQSQQQVYAQERELGEKRKVESGVLASLWAGASLDPTGLSKRVAQAATAAQHAKDTRESEAMAGSPQFKQATSQGDQLAAQSAQMQGDPRLQQLLQVGQQKGCDKGRGTSTR